MTEKNKCDGLDCVTCVGECVNKEKPEKPTKLLKVEKYYRPNDIEPKYRYLLKVNDIIKDKGTDIDEIELSGFTKTDTDSELKLQLIKDILDVVSDTDIETPERESGFYSGIFTSIQTILEM